MDWKWRNDQVGYLWRKMTCTFAGWRNGAEKCWNVNLRKNPRDPSPQHFTHNASLYHRPWTVQGLEDSGFILRRGRRSLSRSDSPLHWLLYTEFTEGLCLYNSGYLHRVRKPLLHTSSVEESVYHHECRVDCSVFVLETLLRCLLLKCWQVLCSALLQRILEIHTIQLII